MLDQKDFASQLADQVNQVLVILYALLGLSVVIAILGIVNTLALSVIERTRESPSCGRRGTRLCPTAGRLHRVPGHYCDSGAGNSRRCVFAAGVE